MARGLCFSYGATLLQQVQDTAKLEIGKPGNCCILWGTATFSLSKMRQRTLKAAQDRAKSAVVLGAGQL